MPSTDELQQQINVLKARMLQGEAALSNLKDLFNDVKADILAVRAKAKADEVLADKNRQTLRRRMKK